MKMLYVYIGGGKTHSSVQAKIISKIRFFNNHGIETKGAFFSDSIDKDFKLNDQIVLYPVRKSKKRYFKGIYDQKYAITTAVQFIRNFEKDFDVIYVRYPGASYWLFKGLKDIGHKIVFEHNTKELDEVIMRAENNSFGLRPSKLFSWLQENRYKIWSERYWAPKILKIVKLGLANTNEIVKYQIDRSDGNYHCELVTNGVDLDKIPLRDPIHFDGENLTLFLMRGAQGLVPYDGTDRLLNGMAQYKGNVKIKLYFIGSSFEEETKMVDALNLKTQVFFTGKLIGDELTALLKTCHISIGTLAIHRKNQIEGSVLRVNESLARGIPVIVAYEDMELNSDPEFKPFYLKLEANDSDIDSQQICDFAQRVYSIKDNHIAIRGLAKKNIDYSIKIQQSIDYIKANFS